MNLSVLMPRKISEEQRNMVDALLTGYGITWEGMRYIDTEGETDIEIWIHNDPENDLFWIQGPVVVVWFIPMTEIELISKAGDKAYRECYRLAKDIAGIVNGVIYDHKINVVYSAEGEPIDLLVVDRILPEYGRGVEIDREKVSDS